MACANAFLLTIRYSFRPVSQVLLACLHVHSEGPSDPRPASCPNHALRLCFQRTQPILSVLFLKTQFALVFPVQTRYAHWQLTWVTPLTPIARREVISCLTGALISPVLLTRADAEVTPEIVKYRPEIEHLVALIERTVRERCAEMAVEQLRRSTSYRQFLAALFLAGIRT